MFQSLEHLWGPLSVQYVHLSLTGVCRTGHTTCQCWPEGKDHLLQDTDNVFPDTAQDTFSLFLPQGYIVGSRSACCPWGPSRSFSAKLLSDQSASSICWCMDLFLPMFRAWQRRKTVWTALRQCKKNKQKPYFLNYQICSHR